MKKKTKKTRKSYTLEFKAQAIDLAKEIGAREAAQKLGIENFQTLSAWIRYSNKIDENEEFKKLEEARAEIKRLKKELETEKKTVAILRDATAFFCQNPSK